MLGFIFGFNARLGRLAYFLSCIAFGVGLMVLGILLILGFQHSGASGVRPGVGTAAGVIIGVILALWLANCLVSMRIRDMGWNPAIVLPVLWVILATDAYVAILVPGWALPGKHYGTVFGSALNFVFNLAVMFWPGTGYDASVVNIRDTLNSHGEPSLRPSNTATKPAPQPVAVTKQPASGRKAFGRLGQQQ
jgi:uncharacterized membrane protein YhaH (DUF805 family)